LEQLPPKGPLKVIVFSDSFFIATPDGDGLLTLCAHLMNSMILNGIPVRMGVASGSCCMYQWGLRSDVHDVTSTTQFLGKGVALAHAVESCGLKGMRIGLHPLVVDHLKLPSWVARPLGREGRRGRCEHEFNYLFPLVVGSAEAPRLQGQVVASVKELHRRVQLDGGPVVHYTRTERALRRMIALREPRASGTG
jgi:hypothetical protein